MQTTGTNILNVISILHVALILIEFLYIARNWQNRIVLTSLKGPTTPSEGVEGQKQG